MQEDINIVIAKHTGLIYHQLRKFNLVGDQDAESIGYEALYNAILNFDEAKGAKLSTVATVYIYNALMSHIRSSNRKRTLKTVSYNNVAYSDDTDEHEFADLIPSEEDLEGAYMRTELRVATRKVFNEMYDRLTNEKHKAILSIWKNSDFAATTVDIAKQLNVSQSYVSQVINNFKFKLKKKLEDLYYD